MFAQFRFTIVSHAISAKEVGVGTLNHLALCSNGSVLRKNKEEGQQTYEGTFGETTTAFYLLILRVTKLIRHLLLLEGLVLYSFVEHPLDLLFELFIHSLRLLTLIPRPGGGRTVSEPLIG